MQDTSHITKVGTMPKLVESQQSIQKVQIPETSLTTSLNFHRWENIIDIQHNLEGMIDRLRIKFNHGYQLSIVKIFGFLTINSTDFELAIIDSDNMMCSGVFPNATIKHVEKVLEYLNEYKPINANSLKLIGHALND